MESQVIASYCKEEPLRWNLGGQNKENITEKNLYRLALNQAKDKKNLTPACWRILVSSKRMHVIISACKLVVAKRSRNEHKFPTYVFFLLRLAKV